MFFSKMKWSVIAGFALVMFIQQSLFGSTDKNLVPALTYNNKCSFCHQAKSVQSLPDLKTWIKLLYTTGCPEVTIQLTENERKAIKTFFEAEYKPKK